MDRFRVAFMPALGRKMYHSKEVGNFELANTMLESIANYTLFLHDSSLMHDHSNTGWVEQASGDDWILID